MKIYMSLGETKFKTAKIIERIEQKKLAKVQALEEEYCLSPKNAIIQITKIIIGKNNPSVTTLT